MKSFKIKDRRFTLVQIVHCANPKVVSNGGTNWDTPHGDNSYSNYFHTLRSLERQFQQQQSHTSKGNRIGYS